MPVTIDDVNEHPEWDMRPHRLQVAAAVQGKFCTAKEAGVDQSRIKEFDGRLSAPKEVSLTPK